MAAVFHETSRMSPPRVSSSVRVALRLPLESRHSCRYSGVANNPVKAAFRLAGFKVLKSGDSYNLCWGAVRRKAEDFAGFNQASGHC